MHDSPSALKEAFLDDHRKITIGLSKLLSALTKGQVEKAIALADELDQVAGSHIAFEEEAFYPQLRNRLGDAFVDQLYREHGLGRRAIAALLSLEGGELTPKLRDEVERQLEAASEHARSCGSLLSHLDSLGAEQQALLLDKLSECRGQPTRWSQRSGEY